VSEAHGLIVPEQGGFRPGRGCPEQLFALTELVKLRRLRGQCTYACFIDVRKAYDTVWLDGLRLCLLRAGIRGRFFDAVCSLYAACESCLRLGDTLGYSDFFPIESGVRQGCILSPLLYSLFINGLAVELKAQRLGASIDKDGASKLCVLLYADDIVLLADSEADLSALMGVVHAYSRCWRFQVNHAKCGLLRFNVAGAVPPTSVLTLGDKPIAWLDGYKYLGVDLRAAPGRPYRLFHQRMLAGATKAAGCIAGMGMQSGKLPVPLGVQVYQALVRPLLEYAAEIWSADGPWEEAERLQTRMAKRILQCPLRTSSTACLGELGWQTLEARWQQLRCGFLGKIVLMQSDMPARRVFDETLRFYHRHATAADGVPADEAEVGGVVLRAAPKKDSPSLVSSLWCAQMHRDLSSLGLSPLWDQIANGREFKPEADRWRERVKVAVAVREQARWWNVVQQKVRDGSLDVFAFLKSAAQLQRASYLEVAHGGWNDRIRIGRVALTMLRGGSSTLRIYTGAWDGVEMAHRYCQRCGSGDVDDERHFLLRCATFADSRAALQRRISQLVQQSQPSWSPLHQWRFDSLSVDEQFRIMAGGGHSLLLHPKVQQPYLRSLLIAVGEWMEQHQQHQQRIRDILQKG